ncbi:MAG: hypothetical protein AB8G95_20510, partial [Anaerolineae bacterium]
YQAGWRELGQSNLDGLVYASNEEEEITNWYMAQAARTHCEVADLFLLGENVQDPIAFNPILTADKAEFEISENLSLFATDRFNFHPGSRMFTPAEISKPRFGGLNPLDVPLGERVTLAGYDISIKSGHVEAVLYWDVKQVFDRNYQAFVHVIDQDGNLVTQHDSAPECGINPTTRWEPGTVVRDPHTINIPADWPADQPLRVLAGMYDLISQERLPVAGEPGNFVYLTEIKLDEVGGE